MLNDKELENIRRKMLELDEEPPVKAWAAIQAEIKPRHRWRFFWWLSSALLILSAISVYFFWDKLPIHTAAPSASAHVPSLAQTPKPIEKQDHSTHSTQKDQPALSISEPEHLLPSAETKPNAEGIKPDLEKAASPINRISKNNLLSQPNIKAPITKGITLKEDSILLIEANTGKIASMPGNPDKKTKPEFQPKHKEKLENNSLPGHNLMQGKSTKPDIEIANTEVTTKKQQTNSDKTGPSSFSENTLSIKPPSQEKLNTPADLEQDRSAEFTNTDPTTSPLVETPVGIPAPDTASVVLEPDTASQAKETIIVTPPGSKGSKEWTVGLFFSPRYSFRIVTPSSSDDIYIENLTTRPKSGSERMGYELGISVSKAITNRLYLESSLAFMQLKENVAYSYTTGKVDTLLRKGSSDGQQIQLTAVYASGNRQLVSSYAYGGWRLGATYYFWQNHRRRFNITMNGGINLLVKGQTTEVINGQESKTINFPSKENILEQTNYNLLIGAGYSLQVMEKYELMFMPTLNYFLGSTFKAREPFGLQPYSLGIHVQVKRRLK
ncbi:hypothetical protein Q0590_27560 [Rhodocytophaga aerolata]|uniref:Outer membrane protein beta-barrel domain-containing protein n=1 Tax=Rhodocytophaga aerolata TaxID=455078 RepID=A0ABT8RFG4_9BACT|nr:hypothetical protein [Rhodocytophaga aerolata]MDO1450069.1 hypothetical protein [Rhodocytophaga aerolata]